MRRLRATACGAGTTIQDAGRFGWQRYGVGPAGAMDRVALALANMLVGNTRGAAAVEFAVLGGSFEVEGGDALVAVAGAAASLTIDGRPVAPSTSARAREGQTIAVGPAREGVFMVLAVDGGVAAPLDLGSASWHQRAGLGGVERGPVRAGQRLPLGPPSAGGERVTEAAAAAARGPFRVVLGPQDDYFSEEGIATFLGASYRVTAEADRMGYRLEGPRIAHAKGFNIVSDGIVTGSVQVPGSGQPIVLLADRQTTGGYPKIATVISADLPRFAQLRTGHEVRFARVSIDEAVAAARAQAKMLDEVEASLRPVGRGLDSERLLTLNLVGGVVSADPAGGLP